MSESLQESFSTFNGKFRNDAEAKQARDARYKELRKKGYAARRWVLRDQLRKYSWLGQPDGSVHNCFMIDASRDA